MTTKKFVIILSAEAGQVAQINGAGHLCLGLHGLVADMALRTFRDIEGRKVSEVSDHPLIILESRNGSRLREAHDEAIAAQIPCSAFFDTMRFGTPEEQAAHIQGSSALDLTYVALALFGQSDTLRSLTRRFSLFKPKLETA